MEANILPSPSFPFTRKPSSLKTYNLRFRALPATSDKSNETKDAEEEQEKEEEAVPRPAIKTVNIRYRARSKNQARQQQQQQQRIQAKPRPPKKEWEDMTLAEKAVELYVGEKGLLFWLNKSAYASIFIIIGGWIVFRFVGPSLGLYQLDAPPLSPTNILKGSP